MINIKFMALANEMANRKASARHLRRAEAKANKVKKSIPAMKKVIRRNKQRKKK